jgi:hypothetical protein
VLLGAANRLLRAVGQTLHGIPQFMRSAIDLTKVAATGPTKRLADSFTEAAGAGVPRTHDAVVTVPRHGIAPGHRNYRATRCRAR